VIRIKQILLIVLLAACISCEDKKTELSWERNFSLIGSQSSPRATDLNNDGVKDIVIGAGKSELDSTPDDVNQNGHPELLTINGGNWEAQPNTSEDRYPGVLMLIDAKDGTVIAADTMPDGKESYMSPIAYKQPGSDKLNILFGTGGETIGGSLYLTSLEDVLKEDLKSAKKLVTGDKQQ